MSHAGEKSGSAREDSLDEALEESFPASDPVALGHSDHLGSPPGHESTSAAGANNVGDRPELQRFELTVDGEVATAYYRVDGDNVVLTHTEVPQALSGRGIGTELAKGVFEIIRSRRQKIVAQCPFMAKFASRHPEYARLVVG